ncbi:hypothetical protein [Crocinitomix algicola]|nr:hypothetical protein [Crocinitomix algicola]
MGVSWIGEAGFAPGSSGSSIGHSLLNNFYLDFKLGYHFAKII